MTSTDLIAAGIVEDELEALDAFPLELLEDFGTDLKFYESVSCPKPQGGARNDGGCK